MRWPAFLAGDHVSRDRITNIDAQHVIRRAALKVIIKCLLGMHAAPRVYHIMGDEVKLVRRSRFALKKTYICLYRDLVALPNRRGSADISAHSAHSR